MGERILVTGGAGFIGSHLVERLVREGHQVSVLDNFASGRRDNLARVLDRVELLEASVTDPEACAEAVRGVRYVFHHAALVSVQESMEHPSRAFAVNSEGTRTLLDAALTAGVRRLVFASTSAYYGDDPVLPKVEDMAPTPVSPYGASKAEGERWCSEFATRGLETVRLRYFNVFGARQSATSSYAAVIPRFISAAVNNQSPVIFGDGEQTRDFVHIDNVVEANILACFTYGISGRAFNIGSGDAVSLNLLWAQIKQMTGCTCVARYEPAREGDIRDSVCSTLLAQARLGFRLRISLTDGLAATIAATSNAGKRRGLRSDHAARVEQAG